MVWLSSITMNQASATTITIVGHHHPGGINFVRKSSVY